MMAAEKKSLDDGACFPEHKAENKKYKRVSDSVGPRRNIYIHQDDWEKLKSLGQGNASAGS